MSCWRLAMLGGAFLTVEVHTVVLISLRAHSCHVLHYSAIITNAERLPLQVSGLDGAI
jgi:hypothetical protein